MDEVPLHHSFQVLTMKTALEMLDRIDTFLVEALIPERRMLWDILCAMRGPDKSEDNSEKEHTTAVLRAVALPKTAAAHPQGVYADFNTKGTLLSVAQRARNFSHFADHIQYAAYALAEMRGEQLRAPTPPLCTPRAILDEFDVEAIIDDPEVSTDDAR